ncbi:MAG: ATP-dependent DNA helicase [Lachnospiraceae bacterium]|nr:ATP-dependent DNA helicase [Lachnospiraceae bacterium]
MKNALVSENIIRISVRGFVEFLLRGGDIDRRRGAREKEAMLEGSRVHRLIQSRAKGDYRPEVPVRGAFPMICGTLLLEGRADGIFSEDGVVWIDEIKGIYRDLASLEAAVPVHEAQAKCYAAIVAAEEGLEIIGVQMTYCHLESRQVRRFRTQYTAAELAAWLRGLVDEYEKWAIWQTEHLAARQAGLKALTFPFPYRPGQKEMAAAVYRAIRDEKELFIQAPTGIGKTLATIFPALKAMGEGLGDRLFYLTAKTMTRSVAEEGIGLLKSSGLTLSSVTLTAKEKICPMEEASCDPEKCPYARGHFDRANEALYDLITGDLSLGRDGILSCAHAHAVCPFELSLDASLFADVVICDYNYAFDPNVRLKRFFADGAGGDPILLIDEAHNLVDRAREMFSAELVKEEILEAKRWFKEKSPSCARRLEAVNRRLLARKRECTEGGKVFADADDIGLAVLRAVGTIDEYLEEEKKPLPDEVIRAYFALRNFSLVYETLDEDYRVYGQLLPGGEFLFRLYCVSPARQLAEQLEKCRSAVFFSATLLPVNYYKELLTGDAEKDAVYAPSPFPPENRLLGIVRDVSSRYKRRSREEFARIWEAVAQTALAHPGNYMAFFPSYAFLEGVREIAEEDKRTVSGDNALAPADAPLSLIFQERAMRETDQEAFLAHFSAAREGGSLIGFCVIGGSFAEGIDLTEDRLIGACIVGPGLPQICLEREILRAWFDAHGKDGYAYAYTYPGMNRVQQAAGRVIRTDTDRGVILLMDDRFTQGQYRRLFPREWEGARVLSSGSIRDAVKAFWDS